MKITIKEILDEMRGVVENQEVRGPGWWLDKAQQLAVLRQTLQSEMVKAEILYRNEIVELATSLPYNKAENMVKGRKLKEGEKMTAYEFYNYLRTRDKVVEEIMRIAKQRARTQEYET